MKNQINEKFLKSLSVPSSKDKLYTDSQLKGFYIRITNKGAISFYLSYQKNGKRIKQKIGDYPVLNCATAKEIALNLKSDLSRGIVPQAASQASVIKTFAELARDVVELKSKTWRPRVRDLFIKTYLQRHILPAFGKIDLSEITRRDIEKFHSSHSAHPINANRLLELIRSTLNQAVAWDLIPKNPAIGIKPFPEHPRERYLNEEEIGKVIAALDSSPYQMQAKAIKLIMLTGSRRGEVLGARWQDFDLENGVWVKPHYLTKQKKSSAIPLSQQAIDLIKSLERKSEFLFFNEKTKKPLGEARKFWASIQKQAGLKDVRIHDLRHTFASVLVNQGVPLETIGKLIGHSNIATTQRYSHLAKETLKNATELASGVFRKKM